MENLIASTTDSEPAFESGYIGRIPIRNLWLLMLYASDLFKQSDYC
jgi:5-methylcytosine-specific restriction enzyme subunit McrC